MKQELMSEKRQRHIDLGAGMLILWMIIYHAWISAESLQEAQRVALEGGSWNTVTNPMVFVPFLLFFMPWFFYKGGMLFRIRPQKQLLVYDTKKLLKPWVIWTVVGYGCFVLESILSETASFHGLIYSVLRGFVLTGRVPINEPLWFLLTLFTVRQIANFTIERIHPLLLALLGGLIAYACYKTQIRLMPDWIANISIGFFFFCCGYYQTHRFQPSVNLQKIIFGVSGLIFVGWCLVNIFLPENHTLQIPIVDMYANVHLQGHYLLWFPICVLGIISFNKLIELVATRYSFPILNWIGKSALLIYAIHAIPQHGLTFLVQKYNLWMNNWSLFGIIIISYVFMILGIKVLADKK